MSDLTVKAHTEKVAAEGLAGDTLGRAETRGTNRESIRSRHAREPWFPTRTLQEELGFQERGTRSSPIARMRCPGNQSPTFSPWGPMAP